MPIPYDDIEIEDYRGCKKISFSIITSKDLKDIQHKAEFIAEIYGQEIRESGLKKREIELLQKENEILEEKIQLLRERIFNNNRKPRKVIFGCVNPKIKEIQERVSVYFGVTMKELTGKSRRASIVKPRHIAMYLCKQQSFSYPDIGEAFDKDHTTVIHAVEKIEAQIKTDEKLKGIIEEVGKNG